ncbi:MAG TPA: glycosyl hydrolase family 28 protein [Nitrolancea sp.]|nr:glycosyl hydrolase family 28 protein [Nitrolancea sp.]
MTNCIMYKGHGAVVIGSETSGGIRNITASNIVSKGTDTGVRIKSQRGRGGVLENFRFDNWVIEDAQKVALEITMRYGRTAEAPLSERTPRFQNFSFSNLTIVNARTVATVEGLPELAIRQLRFTDITASGRNGFLADHANDVELHQVRVSVENGSAFSFDQSTNVVLDAADPETRSKSHPAIALSHSKHVTLSASRGGSQAASFLKVSGPDSSAIRLTGNDLSAAQKDIDTAPDVPATAVIRP